MTNMNDHGPEIYIHIPFCVRKCDYCDFLSFAGKEDLMAAYTDALCAQIKSSGGIFAGKEIASVYIGGGTPSYLPVRMLDKVINELYRYFNIKDTKEKRRGWGLKKKIRPKTEFSIECNPGTVDKSKLKNYKKMGINRISFGLQSTEEAELKTLGRIHSFEDFMDSFEAARETGFDNINVDMMQALPHQTTGSWMRSLALVASLKPEHISAYSLMVEEGTPFYDMNEKGELEVPDEDAEREIYHSTKDFLEKSGYVRYEISNYAVPGFECVHNTGYWKRADYIGLGLGASSLAGNTRWKNTEDIDKYIGSADKGFERVEEERLSHKEQMEEFIFLGLRLSEGISRKRFFELFGQDFDHTYAYVVENNKADGLIDTDGDRVFLTDKGVDVSNRVFADFLLDTGN